MIVDKIKKREPTAKRKENKVDIPVGKWVKCDKCKEIIYKETIRANMNICPNCGGYFRMHINRRLESIIDEGTYQKFDLNIDTTNPLNLEDYTKKIKALREKTGLQEAVSAGKGKINGEDVVICVMDSGFLMGSMGVVVGEKITYSIEKAIELKLPIIIFCVSGGARMQEGIMSLMQMAKTTSAISKLNEAGLLYISVLTDPTYGGVTASFASIADIILAEPGAMIGFAGQRVIEQTIGEKLPEGFQTAEFLLEHGFIDKIVERKDLKQTLSLIIKLHSKCDNKMEDYKKYLSDKMNELKYKYEYDEDKNNLNSWEKVQAARSSMRPTALEYIDRLTKNFYELHGDRMYGDDKSVIGGIAMFGKQPVTVVGLQKGMDTKDNIYRNFGMPQPEGYRKSLRLIKQAEKFHRPVICFVDTPGAYPGMGAEERGQGRAIADNLFEMSDIKTPVLTIVTGEGGSGGALALAVADEVWMMENSIYSILSPEGFASILYKDAKMAEKASEDMKITAKDLFDMGVIEKIIPEYGIMTREKLGFIGLYMKTAIADFLIKIQKMTPEELICKRYDRFRKF